MGSIVEFKCPQCGYQTKLFLGGGMRDCEPETALSCVPHDEGLAEALHNNGWFRINRAPAVCRSCQQLVSAAFVTYQPNQTHKQNVLAVCPGCGGALDWLPLHADRAPCPVCGQTASLVAAGLWD